MPVAEEEPILTNPPTQEMAVHVRDYDRFTKMMFRGAIICGIIGFIVLMILY
jgi:DMSO/TMAO reductase YedYZ heme-binding membrane subunit